MKKPRWQLPAGLFTDILLIFISITGIRKPFNKFADTKLFAMKRVANNNNILVPFDFSDIAANALHHAVKIAEAYNNEITLLHIVEEGGLFSLFGRNDQSLQLLKEGIEGRLDKIIAEIQTNHKVRINKRIEEGKVYKTVSSVANEGNYDSIIMGSNGASGIERIIGSNASRVIQYSTVPVVVIKQQTIGEGYKKIVLPIDLSIESKQKVAWAVHIAKNFDSVIHVIFENSSDEFTRTKINANIVQVKHMLAEAGVRFEVKELEDKFLENFATETINYANSINADLLIIMTQQEMNIGEMIIGTLAQQMVNQSEKVPVMCIHPSPTGYSFDAVL